MKVSCDQLTQIEITEISGCPGFGHHYSPSLHAKTVGKVRSINIDAAGQNFTDGKTHGSKSAVRTPETQKGLHAI